MTPVARGFHHGVRSPVRYGRKKRPVEAASAARPSATRSATDVPGAMASRSHSRVPAPAWVVAVGTKAPGTTWDNVNERRSGSSTGRTVVREYQAEVPRQT